MKQKVKITVQRFENLRILNWKVLKENIYTEKKSGNYSMK